ncbi:hypothetical protein NDU88_002265 [Pleurodeles waltl]|uniref:Uncharacterized protein n=1 Tax=Pleurodeles waltl TaxID=8319 RepID=A0AAV7M7M8_PLEWA|nr:hypothetical protein NDU88_002265 [Pleurodeles waltl]
MESTSISEMSLEDKVQNCGNKAVSTLAIQLEQKFDDCLERLELKFGNKTDEEQFWSVEEATVKAVGKKAGLEDTDDEEKEIKTFHKYSGEKEQVRDPLREYMLDPHGIQRTLSPQWVQQQHVAEYVEYWIKQEMTKEVRTRLRSECPRPSLANKVAYTPELNAQMLTFLNKSGRDPRRG